MSAVKRATQTHKHPWSNQRSTINRKRQLEGYDSVDFINFPLFIDWWIHAVVALLCPATRQSEGRYDGGQYVLDDKLGFSA